MLTTTDNPYNPWTQYDEWQQYDHDHNYYTAEYIASLMDNRIDSENEKLYDNIVNEIVELNLLGIYTIWPESKTVMG